MELLTPKETSQLLKISIHTLAKWRSQRQGPDYVKTGRSVKYCQDVVNVWIAHKTIKMNQGRSLIRH
jgi:predicted DNA-binding transcriptional regulator AlpA